MGHGRRCAGTFDFRTGGHVAESHGDYYAKCVPPPPKHSHHRFLADRVKDGVATKASVAGSAFSSWDQAYAWYANVYKFTEPKDITEGYTEADWPGMAVTIDECEAKCAAHFPSGRGVLACVEIKILRRFRPESPRRPPRHRRDACSTAWRCRFLTARWNQRGHVIAEK